MPFRYSEMASRALTEDRRQIADLRNAPVRNRDTRFRLAQQNMLAYTFESALPGWSVSGLNSMPFLEVVQQCTNNALDEGALFYGTDFTIKQQAIAKVTGDVYEILTSGILWDAAARWNRYMNNGEWLSVPRYSRPTVKGNKKRQVAVINLPRRYDWVKLLVPDAQDKIRQMRLRLAEHALTMPTSTPDIAIVVLPEEVWDDEIWSTPIGCLGLPQQALLSKAYERIEGKVEPGEIILAMALKSSLRSDRIYQPLYEANVMQLLLEGHLGAPKVEFEVHVLSTAGTDAGRIYQAATLHSAYSASPHRAVRELYEPANALQIVNRFFGFLNNRTDLVSI